MVNNWDFDFIIIGSGFGGSVSALRLVEKGYRVAVLEMGKRYRAKDFPKTNWHLKKFLWEPRLGLHGTLRLSFLRHAWILSGVGVGGGSLVYANTLLAPPERVWDDPHWAYLQDWKKVMPPFYALARQMLGVTCNHYLGTADRLLQQAAMLQGFGHTFYPTEVGVYFGEKGKTVPDPYFAGEGPERTGCMLCGGCMLGCRYGAKNSLDQNYLYLAEKYGVQIFPETMVVEVKPLAGQADGGEGYVVEAVRSTGLLRSAKTSFTSRGIVFAGGVLGTVKLLLSLKEKRALPHLSGQIGKCVRTNSESILAVQMHDKSLNLSDGVAIGSGIYIDEETHIEAVRYPEGSDFMSLMATLLTRGKPGPGRILTWLGLVVKNPLKFLKSLVPFGFAKSTLVILVMQSGEGQIELRLKRSLYPPFKKILTTEGNKIPAYIPQATAFTERLSQDLGGTPKTSLGEIFLNVPSTAHILGGAIMGTTPAEGVIDYRCRVFNYKNMYICDGSMIGANLGVNPSLTITALAEHAMSYIKPAGETNWQDEPLKDAV